MFDEICKDLSPIARVFCGLVPSDHPVARKYDANHDPELNPRTGAHAEKIDALKPKIIQYYETNPTVSLKQISALFDVHPGILSARISKWAQNGELEHRNSQQSLTERAKRAREAIIKICRKQIIESGKMPTYSYLAEKLNEPVKYIGIQVRALKKAGDL